MQYNDFVNITTTAANGAQTFLIDTQADISVIKETSIENQQIVDENDIIFIKGITNATIQTTGSTTLEICLGNQSLTHKFHIVPDIFNIHVEGIIGKDFLKKYKCLINYENMSLTINTGNTTRILTICDGPRDDTFVIPPRTIITKQFRIASNNPCVVSNRELQPGVFVARTIVNAPDAHLQILNTKNCPVQINKQILKFEPLSDFHVYNIDKLPPNSTRNDQLIKLLTKQIPLQFRDNLIPLLSEFNDIFAMPSDPMTINNFYEQTLRLKDTNPVYIKNYRTPYSSKTEIKSQIKQLKENDLIEPCSSEFNSPIVLVPKKSQNGIPKWRLCMDYRQINKKLVPDRWPLPRIDDVLDGLGRAQHFTVLDLSNGFHQIPLAENSRDITAFSSDDGHFRWKVLPFGLSISPNSFSRMMSIAFSGLPPHKMFLYMDDIIVLGRTEKNHLNNLRDTFLACRMRNLKINPEKCRFFRTEVLFLGHLCTNNGIKPDPSKFECIRNYPRPHDSDAVRRFVALANYYRKFLKDFAILSSPLNRLTRKNTIFEWTLECQTAFDKIKNALLNTSALAYPDYSREFTLTVDASKQGVGAVLSQNDIPIAFASKAFTKADSNKATIEQELLAIHWSINHFKHYLYGTSHFTVQSDHKPLTYLYNLKDPNSKLSRLRLELSEYNFTVIHIPGKLNSVADALSRIHIRDIIRTQTNADASIKIVTRSMTRNASPDNTGMHNKDTTTNATSTDVKCKIYEATASYTNPQDPLISLQLDMPHNTNKYVLRIMQGKKTLTQMKRDWSGNANLFLSEIFAEINKISAGYSVEQFKILSNDNIFTLCTKELFKQMGNELLKEASIIITKPLIFVSDQNERERLLNLYHNNAIFGGHVGTQRMQAKLKQQYTWPYMNREIANLVNSCHECRVNKARANTKIPMCITDTPEKPFDTLSIDTIGPLAVSINENKYAITVMCNLTKFLICIPIPNKEALTIAKNLVERIFLTFGLCSSILTDMGTEYCNQIFTETARMLNIQHLTSTPYHPQTLGGVERSHRTLNEYLRHYVTVSNEWDTLILYFAYCYNITPSTTFDHKFSPFELLFGRQARRPEIIKTNTRSPVYNFDNYSVELRHKLQTTNKIARDLLIKTKMRNKKIYDQKLNDTRFKINDKVLTISQSHKLQSVYDGPYTVTKLDKFNVTIRHDVTKKEKKLHQNRIIKYMT